MIRAMFSGRARALFAASLLLAFHAYAAVMTNKDVISLLEAGMGEDVVLQAILTSETKFDTSAQALIRLKQKGASPAVLKAMMPGGKEQAKARQQPRAAAATTATAEKKVAAAGGLNPEEVLIVVDGTETPMQLIIPGNRTSARALGFGGVASYAVLRGTKAQRRIPVANVEFLVSVPKAAQVTNYVTLANFAVRDNGSREVLIGGGFMSYSTGIHPDRIVAITAEAHEDQSRAREGFVLFRVRVTNPMPAGEYALVLYTGEIRTAGFFAQASNSYYDFGVD